MAYQSHHYSTTLRYSICISFFCTLLALSVLFPFILSTPCPFNAPFPFCRFLLMLSASFYTPQSHPTTTPRSLLFCILIVSVLLVHAICTKLLHDLTLPPFSPSGCLCALHSAKTSLTLASTLSLYCISSSCRVLYLIIIATLQLLWRFPPRIQHHWVLC
jgi:hypothetical protein